MKSEDYEIPKNVIYRKNNCEEASEKGIKKNSFLIESLLSSDKKESKEVIESDSNSCVSSPCSSPSTRSISPGCENENLESVKEHRIPYYPFPHPSTNFPHHYQNFELFYHPRNFYFENYEFNRKLKIYLRKSY